MSERDSRTEIASSAIIASMGQKPASSTMSTARIRRIISSSTTRTFGTWIGSVDMVISFSLGGPERSRHPRNALGRLPLTDVRTHCCASRAEKASQFACGQRYLVSTRRSDHDQADRTESLEG